MSAATQTRLGAVARAGDTETHGTFALATHGNVPPPIASTVRACGGGAIPPVTLVKATAGGVAARRGAGSPRFRHATTATTAITSIRTPSAALIAVPPADRRAQSRSKPTATRPRKKPPATRRPARIGPPPGRRARGTPRRQQRGSGPPPPRARHDLPATVEGIPPTTARLRQPAARHPL